MNSIHAQRGSTLLVGLIMLILLTIIAISALSSTSASIQVVGNAQFREQATMAGQRAIETLLSNGSFITNAPAIPPAQNIDINLDGTPEFTVTFGAPTCLSLTPAYSNNPDTPQICWVQQGSAPLCYWIVWDISATVTDVVTGANVVVHQGVRTVSSVKKMTNAC